MTPTWYNSPARLAALQTAAANWLGTPFRENSACPGPGGGVSCHNLVAAVYFDSGCWPRFEVPRGRARALTNRNAAEFLAAFDAATAERLAIVPPAEPALPGDTLFLADPRGLRHLGVAITDRDYLHVSFLGGVMLSPLAETGHTLTALRRPRP
jgi:hypothetical protein